MPTPCYRLGALCQSEVHRRGSTEFCKLPGVSFFPGISFAELLPIHCERRSNELVISTSNFRPVSEHVSIFTCFLFHYTFSSHSTIRLLLYCLKCFGLGLFCTFNTKSNVRRVRNSIIYKDTFGIFHFKPEIKCALSKT